MITQSSWVRPPVRPENNVLGRNVKSRVRSYGWPEKRGRSASVVTGCACFTVFFLLRCSLIHQR